MFETNMKVRIASLFFYKALWERYMLPFHVLFLQIYENIFVVVNYGFIGSDLKQRS